MFAYLPAIIVFSLGVVVGATCWHVVYAQLAKAYAVAQNDIAWLRGEVGKVFPAPAAAVSSAPAVPAAAPVAPVPAVAAVPAAPPAPAPAPAA